MTEHRQWGGKRPGAGRPKRTAPKAKPIWCGQITEDERRLIVANLTPDERFQVLIKAASASD
jgi:hypothetical protein